MKDRLQIAEVRDALTDQAAGTRTRVTATVGINETLDKAFAARLLLRFAAAEKGYRSGSVGHEAAPHY
jgi:hypothetical protein